MLPRFEKDICVGEAKSSKLPVGIIMSMPWKGESPGLLESNEKRGDWLREPTTCSSWMTIAGRLGALCRLEGDGGSLLCAVDVDDAKAESLRSSSSASSVLFRIDALGPGLVRGRRTLLSQPRAAGPFSEGVAAVAGGAHIEGAACALGAEVVATRALPESSAASSLMTTRGAASSHEAVPGNECGPGEMKGHEEAAR